MKTLNSVKTAPDLKSEKLRILKEEGLLRQLTTTKARVVRLISFILVWARYQCRSVSPHCSTAEHGAVLQNRAAPEEGLRCAQRAEHGDVLCAGRGEERGKASEGAVREEIICSSALNFCTERFGCVCRGAAPVPREHGHNAFPCTALSLSLFHVPHLLWLWLLSTARGPGVGPGLVWAWCWAWPCLALLWETVARCCPCLIVCSSLCDLRLLLACQ